MMPEPLSGGLLRAFGKYVAVTERHLKKAVQAQLKAHPGTVYVDEEVMKKERSAGEDQWRTNPGPLGPNLVASFANSASVYRGRLHIFDADTGDLFRIDTHQGDSEILLIDSGNVYYRVSNGIYTARISHDGVGRSRLLIRDDAVSDAHWAFLRH